MDFGRFRFSSLLFIMLVKYLIMNRPWYLRSYYEKFNTFQC